MTTSEGQSADGWQATAFAPAHVTGFFEIHDHHKNPYRKGSRGAGLNLDVGVTAHVTIEERAPGVDIFINDVIDDAPTVRRAVRGVLGDGYPAHVTIRLSSVLPASQGFGLSGAGALASTLALAEILGFATKSALWEAHKAEVESATGLGDVPAQFVGGAEIRITPGPMPMGVVERFAGMETRRIQVVCCVLPGPLSTASVLGDPVRRERVNAAANGLVERLKADANLATYARLSRGFADASGLVSPALQEALKEADRHGPATQTMLGNALHLLVPPDKAVRAADALKDFGEVWVCGVSTRGAHVVRSPSLRERSTG